jgi:RNA polymerase sigma-70 factor (ECF subfamily)
MDRAAKPETSRSEVRPGNAGRLSAEEFAASFNQSFRLFWLIAVGITRDAALAEDIVQDAAMIALRKLEEFQPGTSFNAWMGQTVRFVAYNASRKEQHRRNSSLQPADTDGGLTRLATPEQAELTMGRRGELSADQGCFDDHVMSALSEISETARACLMLRTLGGLEYSEISKVLDIPEGTAMSHVHRSRKTLRDQLAPHFAGWAGTVGGEA